MRAHVACVVVLVVVAVLSVPAAAAQTFGLIQGRVSDASGAVLPGASVTVSDEQTGLIRSVVTNEQGLYRVPALNPGSYFAGSSWRVSGPWRARPWWERPKRSPWTRRSRWPR